MLNVFISFKRAVPPEILRLLKNHRVETASAETLSGHDVVLFEGSMEEMKAIKEADPRAEVIFFGQGADSIEVIKQGAFAHFTFPVDVSLLKDSIERITEVVDVKRATSELEKKVSEKYVFHGLIGKNPLMLEVFNFIRRIAPYYRIVTITGETGVGKELVAKAIHAESPISKEPFIVFNCGGVVENLVESELFGHKKGAFTGAVEDKAGLFETARNGVIFLDEVGDLPLTVQTHLLRVLQDGEFRRLGSTKTVKAVCRVIAATNKDLAEEVKKGRFREDLFFRLTPLMLNVPALRSRKDDMALLARFFIKKTNFRLGKNIQGMSMPVQTVFMSYDWHGNVRELENTIERAIILTTETFIRLGDLPEYLVKGRIKETDVSARPRAETLSLEQTIKQHIKDALIKCSGNKTKTAEILGITRRALIRKIEKYSL